MGIIPSMQYGMADPTFGSVSDPTTLAAMMAAYFFVIVIALVICYIYMGFVLSTIAKKLGYEKPWLAWIPIAQFALYPILAKKNWPWVFILLVPIVNIVFLIMWTWNIFEQRKYPGWLSLLPLGSCIPFISGLFGLATMVVWGLVAWKDR
jgi:hypothetical protein